MSRRTTTKKRLAVPDPVYNSISVNMLVNRVMKSGKKSVAYRIVYNTLKEIYIYRVVFCASASAVFGAT